MKKDLFPFSSYCRRRDRILTASLPAAMLTWDDDDDEGVLLGHLEMFDEMFGTLPDPDECDGDGDGKDPAPQRNATGRGAKKRRKGGCLGVAGVDGCDGRPHLSSHLPQMPFIPGPGATRSTQLVGGVAEAGDHTDDAFLAATTAATVASDGTVVQPLTPMHESYVRSHKFNMLRRLRCFPRCRKEGTPDACVAAGKKWSGSCSIPLLVRINRPAGGAPISLRRTRLLAHFTTCDEDRSSSPGSSISVGGSNEPSPPPPPQQHRYEAGARCVRAGARACVYVRVVGFPRERVMFAFFVASISDRPSPPPFPFWPILRPARLSRHPSFPRSSWVPRRAEWSTGSGKQIPLVDIKSNLQGGSNTTGTAVEGQVAWQSSDSIVYSFTPEHWHYGWESSRHSSLQKHCVQFLLVEEDEDPSTVSVIHTGTTSTFTIKVPPKWAPKAKARESVQSRTSAPPLSGMKLAHGVCALVHARVCMCVW